MTVRSPLLQNPGSLWVFLNGCNVHHSLKAVVGTSGGNLSVSYEFLHHLLLGSSSAPLASPKYWFFPSDFIGLSSTSRSKSTSAQYTAALCSSANLQRGIFKQEVCDCVGFPSYKLFTLSSSLHGAAAWELCCMKIVVFFKLEIIMMKSWMLQQYHPVFIVQKHK